MAQIIAISGPMGSGKSTIGDFLVRSRGYKSMAHADTLKDVASVLFTWPREMLEGRTEAARKEREQVDEWWSEALDDIVSPRSMLQRLGTEVFRGAVSSDIWILCLKRKLIGLPKDAKVVITDARFLNELNALEKMGAKLYGVSRKPPTWLEDFYRYVDKALVDETGAGIQLMTEEHHNTAIEAGVWFFADRHLNAHASEWQFYLYNNYEQVFDNSGSLRKFELALIKEFYSA
jgi:hypothetical protein